MYAGALLSGAEIYMHSCDSYTLYAEFLPTKHKGKCVVLMDVSTYLWCCMNSKSYYFNEIKIIFSVFGLWELALKLFWP